MCFSCIEHKIKAITQYASEFDDECQGLLPPFVRDEMAWADGAGASWDGVWSVLGFEHSVKVTQKTEIECKC